ncbi:beta-lactamase-like protein [Coniochaeta sp. 2T2.1]|nr:beta-lactamase-like protein [Coniochaeta sp. 2T2.1]
MATLYATPPAVTPTRRPGTSSFIPGDSKEASTETVAVTDTETGTVKVHVLSAGHFSLPEEQFVSPSTPGARHAVPSLCFLIEHTDAVTRKTTRIVFDLGLRRDVARYPPQIQQHLTTRVPYTTDPDVVKSLKAGGLTPDDIDYVIYSHVHWDHVGEPRDFTRSTFVVGHGSLDVLHGKSSELRGNHSHFEADLLDPARTVQLPNPNSPKATSSISSSPFSTPWHPLNDLPAVLDVFNDNTVYVVNAPGHLPGHINLLIRSQDPSSFPTPGKGWIYLAGDACHDRRILRKEREIGEWDDVHGRRCCIHADRKGAEETIERIRALEERGVEVIFAHDVEWESDARNRGRFFGAGDA